MFTIQKILSGGGGGGGGGGWFACPENFILFCHRGQCGPGPPFEARGPTSSRGCQ